MKLSINAFWTIFFLFLFGNINAHTTSFTEYNKEDVIRRLGRMESIVTLKYTRSVEGYLKGYTVRNRERTERILGRVVKFFPLFEKYLRENEMPDDLKYLAIVESALVPKAVSRVGAGGLWQFMPATGKSYDLNITRYVDDRSCPHKSTQAAMKYLAKLYKRYNNWELALAAYNSGGGRVNRAIKLARSRNFWRLQRYLPRETQNYVPGFIAATYLLKHYDLHGLKPILPEKDLQMTESVKVYDYLTFQKITEITGVSRFIIEELNPSYLRGFIPENMNGHYLTLPKRVMPAMKDYFKLQNPDVKKLDALDVSPIYVNASSRNESKNTYFKSIYTVAEGDQLWELAKLFECSAYHIKMWNGLSSSYLTPGQELEIYYPSEYSRYLPLERKDIKIEALPTRSLNKFPTPESDELENLEAPKPDFIYYQLQRYESLMDVAERFENVTIQDIVLWNGFTRKNMPIPGSKIKIRND